MQSLALVGASAAIAVRLQAAEAELASIEQRLEAAAVPTAQDLMRDVAAHYKQLMLDLRSALDKETDRERTRRLLADLLGEVIVGRDEDGAFADLADPATRLLSAASGGTYITLVAGACNGHRRRFKRWAATVRSVAPSDRIKRPGRFAA